MSEEKIIMFDDPEADEKVTVELWKANFKAKNLLAVCQNLTPKPLVDRQSKRRGRTGISEKETTCS